MNSLSEIIKLMDKSDKKEFIQYLNNRNKRSDTKNIQYFKLIESNDIINEKNWIFKQNSMASYHALRKRLYDNLIEFMSNKQFEKNTGTASEALRFLVLSRYFFENDLDKTGFKYLTKAEKKAENLEQFNLLSEIYQMRLQYLHLNPNENIESLMDKLLENQKQIQIEAKLNFGYALLRKELQEIQQSQKVVDLRKLIYNTLKNLQLEYEDFISYKSLYQILFIANEFASLNHDFSLIAPFVSSSLNFIENQKEKGKNHIFYRLNVFYFLANIQFRNQKFSACNLYLNEMERIMKMNNKTVSKSFFLLHQQLKSLISHFLGDTESAQTILSNTLKKSSSKTEYKIYNTLLLIQIMYFTQLNNKLSIKYINKFQHSDSYYEKKLGMLWTIRKNLMEILIHTQFKNDDFALSRIGSFKRRYKKYLNDVNEQRVIDYVQIVERLIKNKDLLSNSDFRNDIRLKMNINKPQDIFVTCFWGWLLSLIDKKIPYDSTLELLQLE